MRYYLHCCLLLLTICLWGSIAIAQPDTLWSNRFFTAPLHNINSVIETANGEFLLVGDSNPSSTNPNMFACRVNSSGALLWTHAFGPSGADGAYGVVEMPNGEFIISGTGSTNGNVRVLRISSSGDSLGCRSYARGGAPIKGYGITLLRDGNVAIVAYRPGTSNSTDLWVLKCRPTCDTMWTRIFGGTGSDIGISIKELPDSSLLVGGHSQQSGASTYDFWMEQISKTGVQRSNIAASYAGTEICSGMAQLDSAVFLCGRSAPSGPANYPYVCKFHLRGQLLWGRSYPHGVAEEQARGIVTKPGGGVMVAGWAGTNTNTRQAMLMGIDWAGNEEWRWVFGPDSSYLEGIIPVSSGGYLAFGRIVNNGVFTYLLRIARPTGINGTVVDAVNHDPAPDTHVRVPGWSGFSVTDSLGRFSLMLPLGTYDVIASSTCTTNDTAFGTTVQPGLYAEDSLEMDASSVVLPTSISLVTYNDMLVTTPFRLTNSGTGTLTYSVSVIPVRPVTPWISVSPSSGAIQPGQSDYTFFQIQADTTNAGVYDFQATLYIRTNACPDTFRIIPVMVAVMDADETESLLPKSYELSAFPNPFNPATTVSLALPKMTTGKLVIYDITGRQISTLADGLLTAGNHRFAFDAAALPSGIYFAHFESSNFTQTQKMVLLK